MTFITAINIMTWKKPKILLKVDIEVQSIVACQSFKEESESKRTYVYCDTHWWCRSLEQCAVPTSI